jgi:hypothetical protein
MALINTIIGPSGVELIKHRIAAILKTELENQKVLQEDTFPINVFVDRMVPIDKSEIVVINVRFESINPESINQHGSQEDATFTIDTWAVAKQTSTKRGDLLSTNLRDKITFQIKAILQSNFYVTLGFIPGLIMSSNVQNIEPYEPNNNQDASFVSMARLNHNVRFYQDYKVWEGVEVTNNLTNVKLSNTELGYKYELIN